MEDKRWTLEQIEYLKQNYAILNMAELCQKINKTEYAIRWKASQLRITVEKGNEYSKEEDTFILSNHKKLTFQEIAEHLNRTKSSVSKRFHKIKPVKLKNYRKSWVEIEDNIPFNGNISESYNTALSSMKNGQSFVFEKKPLSFFPRDIQ